MIRPGTLEDLDALMGLIGEVSSALRAEGIDQWDETYPDRTMTSPPSRPRGIKRTA